MRVLVVGGTGFLGQHIVTELERRGHRATILARRPVSGADIRIADATELSIDEWADLLTGHDGPVFAAGADDRVVPRRPAAAYFAILWQESRYPLVAPRGSTAVVSTRVVAEAAVGAFERAAADDYPVAEENLTWHELVRRLALAAGRPAPVTVRNLPRSLLGGVVRVTGWAHRVRGREPGLASAHLAELLTQDLVIDPAIARDTLGADIRSLDGPFAETVAAAR